jgi:hypothetical protein
MTTSDVIAIVSVCIAGLALGWSIWAGRKASVATAKANELHKQQNVLHEQHVAIQKHLVQIEEWRDGEKQIQSLKAIIRAELGTTDSGHDRLFVLNKGQGTARNVKITLDGEPLLEHEAIPDGEEEAKTIGPESEVSYCVIISMDCVPSFEFEATWDDDSGQQGQYCTTLK